MNSANPCRNYTSQRFARVAEKIGRFYFDRGLHNLIMLIRKNDMKMKKIKSLCIYIYLHVLLCNNIKYAIFVLLSVQVERLSGMPTLEHAAYNCPCEKLSVFRYISTIPEIDPVPW